MSNYVNLSTITSIVSHAGDLQRSDPIDSLTSSSAKSAKPSKMGGHGFLQRLFYRQPSLPKLASRGAEDELMWTPPKAIGDATHMDFEVLPCPYIRPLGKRLEPRVESAPVALGRQFVGSTMTLSHREGEGSRITRRRMAPHHTVIKPHDVSLVLNDIRCQYLMSIGELALAATVDENYVVGWEHYLKCYSEGRYSLTAPPSPPPKDSKFIYLPSIYPTNEAERLAAFQSSPKWSRTDVVWTGLEIECARSLIMAATTKFDLPSAAISFFDRDHEIVQAERGYSRHLIPRHESIASHVLLTDEVMTILDTQNDWRFSGNPLVLGNPKIRFFAGVPLLSADGQAIGVFAVFGHEPRSSFSVKQRRHLIDLSDIAARELINTGQVLSSIGHQESSRPRQVYDDNRAISHTSSPSLPSSTDTESKNPYPILRYHKNSQNAIRRSRLFINSGARYAHVQNGEQTPPSSDNSDAENLPMTVQPSNIGGNDRYLSLATVPKDSLSDGSIPDSPTCGALLPKFYSIHRKGLRDSGPDCLKPAPLKLGTALNGMCDNVRSFVEARPVSNTFSSNEAHVLLTPDPETSIELFSDVSSLSINSEDIQTLLEGASFIGEENESELVGDSEVTWANAANDGESSVVNSKREAIHGHINRHMKIAFTFDSLSPRLLESIDVQAEARFAAELWANNLSFDAVYAVELISIERLVRKSELDSPGNIETRILVAYGLPDPIDFDIAIHLNVLRGSGAITWENKNALPEEYGRGFMMPLPFESGVLDCHSCGVVFGAFRRRPVGIKGLPKLRSAEVERLQRAANVLKDILCRAPWLRRPSYDEV